MTPALTYIVTTLSIVVLGALRRPPRPLQPPARSAHEAAGSIASGTHDRSGSHAPTWFGQALVEVGLQTDPTSAWLVARWAATLTLGLAAMAAGPAFAAITGAVLLASPCAVRRLMDRRSADRRDAQLPQALERLASSVRAGSALGPAFAAMARSTPEPLGHELRTTAAEVEHGAGLATALDRWSDRPHSGSEVRLAAAALCLAADAGGEVARSVDRVAATLRERRELRAEVRALATQARASAGVLAAAPLAFTALVSSVEPAAITFLLTSPVGLICLAAGLTLEALGAAWMAHILRSAA